MNRRHFLQLSAAGALASATPKFASANPTIRPSSKSDDSFRFAFMSCIHYRYDYDSPAGLRQALKSISSEPNIDFIMTGGDIFQNLRNETVSDSKDRIDSFQQLWAEETSIETYHCIGNHDLVGWRIEGEESKPGYGKKGVLEGLGLDRSYYSFDHKGWHFVVLDYLKINEPGDFSPTIDDEQLHWLAQDIAQAAGKPTVIFTHAPFMSSAEAFTDRGVETEEGRFAPYGRVISNFPEVLEAVGDHQITACINSHLHLVEEIRHKGIRHINCGSVSGHQWTGPRLNTPEGYGLFECQPSGQFEFDYVTYRNRG